jgi:hypothetical protein
MSEARTVTATFEPVPVYHELTVSRNGAGAGHVGGPGIDCGTDCSESYLEGEAVSLSATPAADSLFAGWSGACSGTGACTVSMSEARSVTATFEPAPGQHELVVTKSGAGAGTVSGPGIDCGTDCQERYSEGSVVVMTATAPAGSTFDGWTGACTSMRRTCQVTMNQAKSLTASFIQTPASAQIYWGSWIDGDVYGRSGDAPWDYGTWDLFDAHAQKRPAIVHFGQPPPWEQIFYPGPLNLGNDRGAIALMDQSTKSVSLRTIANGGYDSYYRSWAQGAKAYGKPFFFRWNWEMNGTWFNWGAQAAQDPATFVAAWRHVHDVITAQGATNVTWVWCPNAVFSGSTPLSSLYPGDAYVDWTCMDAYNWGTNPYKPDSWKSFIQTFTSTYNSLLTLAPDKPIMIGETASSEYGGSKAAWIDDAFQVQLPSNFPEVEAVVWFNWNVFEHGGRHDWPIESSPSAQAAFARSIAGSYYATNSFGNLAGPGKVQPLP